MSDPASPVPGVLLYPERPRFRPVFQWMTALTAFVFTSTTMLPAGWAWPTQQEEQTLRVGQARDSKKLEAGLEEALGHKKDSPSVQPAPVGPASVARAASLESKSPMRSLWDLNGKGTPPVEAPATPEVVARPTKTIAGLEEIPPVVVAPAPAAVAAPTQVAAPIGNLEQQRQAAEGWLNRRDFLKRTGAAAIIAGLASNPQVEAQTSTPTPVAPEATVSLLDHDWLASERDAQGRESGLFYRVKPPLRKDQLPALFPVKQTYSVSEPTEPFRAPRKPDGGPDPAACDESLVTLVDRAREESREAWKTR